MISRALSPEIWALIYTVQLLLVSTALGAVAIRLPRQLRGTRTSRFLVGFTLAPFLIAIWTLMLAAVLPGASRLLFLVVPVLLALPILVRNGARLTSSISKEWGRVRAVVNKRRALLFIYACSLLLAAMVMVNLAKNARQPFLAHDALIYVNEAVQFARERSIPAIPDFTAGAGELAPAHPHSFLYQAFLAHALMATGSNRLGFPYDSAARFAVQILVFYVFLSMVALAATSGCVGAGALSLILLLQVPHLEYMSYASSRDPFRIVPLLLLATVLADLKGMKLHRALSLSQLVPCVILTAISLAAHTINVVMVAMIIVAWSVWASLRRVPLRTIVSVIGAAGIGLCITGLHYAKSYTDTGNIMGYGFFYYAYMGTPLWDAFVERRGFLSLNDATVWERLMLFLRLDHFRLSLEAMVVAIVSPILWVRTKKVKQVDNLIMIGLIVVLGMLPAVGAFDFGRVKASQMFASNVRYSLHYYPFAAAFVSMVVLWFYSTFDPPDKRRRSNRASAILVAFVLITCVISGKSVRAWRVAETEQVNQNPLWQIRETLSHLDPDRRVLLDRRGTSYYFDNASVFVFSRAGGEILHARNIGELRSTLHRLGIRYVLLEGKIYGWWERTLLFHYLVKSSDSSLIARGKGWRLYEIKSVED